jgi:two-component system, OmpR family, KDP operon response regulator KdpE
MSRILIVDDDPQLVRALSINLRARGYDVEATPDGAAALAAFGRRPSDLVILDLGLPDLDGVEVIHGLRGWAQVPIIVLSAREGQRDKVAALDAGADDFVTKPFGMDELLARMRAALRRSPALEDQPTLETDSFTVDFAAKRVMLPEGETRLTPTEWHLLEILARNAGKLVTQRQLLHDVWGPAYESETNYLRVYIAQLRRKLEPDPSRPRHLITEAGMGYRLQP